MVIRIFFCCFAFIVLWSLGLQIISVNIDTVQSQWNGNIIKVEDYIYSNSTIDASCIIVGSSLAARIPVDQFNSKIVNLALGGLSIFDGLQVIASRGESPKVVCIEMNFVSKRKNKDFMDEVFSPLYFKLKRYIPALLTRNQPIAVLKGFIRYKPNKIKTDLMINSLPNKVQPIPTAVLERFKAQYSQPLSISEVEERFLELKSYVDKLEAKNCRVIFFEMPVHELIKNSVQASTIRKLFYTHFPKGKYYYIQQPDCKQYDTTDGIHLEAYSAIKYAGYFRMHMPKDYQ